MQTARRLRMPVTEATVEFGKLQKVTGISVREAKDIFKRFAKMKAEDAGSDEAASAPGEATKITYAQFCKGLGLPESELTEEVFHQLDRSDSGKIDFREYLIGVTLTGTDADVVDTMDLAFGVFDRSGKGQVTRDDLFHILETVFPQLSSTDSDQLFKQVAKKDADHITIDDYREFLKKHPEYAIMMQSMRRQGWKPPNRTAAGALGDQGVGSTRSLAVVPSSDSLAGGLADAGKPSPE